METNVERGAAALFAAGVAYAVHTLSTGAGQLEFALGAGLLAYLSCVLLFGLVARSERRLAVPLFDLREFGDFEQHGRRLAAQEELVLTETDRIDHELVLTEADRVNDELALTDADRVETRQRDSSEPLVLDDVLAAVSEDSRVVRLFDRKAMPTPGQLSSRIDRHLGDGPTSPRSDAAQALSDALAELKRSLR